MKHNLNPNPTFSFSPIIEHNFTIRKICKYLIDEDESRNPFNHKGYIDGTRVFTLKENIAYYVCMLYNISLKLIII